MLSNSIFVSFFILNNTVYVFINNQYSMCSKNLPPPPISLLLECLTVSKPCVKRLVSIAVHVLEYGFHFSNYSFYGSIAYILLSNNPTRNNLVGLNLASCYLPSNI